MLSYPFFLHVLFLSFVFYILIMKKSKYTQKVERPYNEPITKLYLLSRFRHT